MSLTNDIFAKRGTWQLFEGVGGHDLAGVKTGHVDQQGRLWLRLPQALLCTDGRHVIEYYPGSVVAGARDSLAGFTPDDRYWIVTPDLRLLAIALEDGSTEDHTARVPGLEDVYWLWTSPHRDILLGTPGKLVRYNGRTATTVEVPRDENGRIHSATISPQGDLWCTSHLGLHRVVDGAMCRSELPIPSEYHLWEVIAEEDGTLWIAVSGLLLRVHNGTVEQLADRDIITSRSYTPLLVDDEKNLWIAMHFRGTVCVNRSGTAAFPFEDTPGLSWPRCMVQDGLRAFWLIGVGNGILRYDPRTLHVVLHGYIEASAMAADGRLWMTAASKGLLVYDGRDVRQLSTDLPARCVGVSVAEDGDIYVSSPYGLHVFDAKRAELRSAREILDLKAAESRLAARSTVWDHEGGLWLNCPTALYRWGPSGLAAYTHEELGFGERLFLFADSAGTVWLMSDARTPVVTFGINGFARRVDRLGDWIRDGKEMNVSCCMEDTDGNLWIGSSQGRLARLCPATGRADPMIELEGGANIRHLRLDEQGRVWISTSQGLFLCDGSSSYPMTEAALLPSRRIVASYALPDERVLIVTELGLCEYEPNRTIRPQLRVSTVIADKCYDAPGAIVVSEPRPVVTVRLTAVNLKPGPLRYQTRLLGYDDDWTDTWTEQIHFPDLPVGTYTFEARAVDQDLMTSPETARVELRITPDVHEAQIAELEGELRGAEDFADNVIRSINDAIVVLTVNGRIALANYATLNLLGYEEKELIGKSAQILFPPHEASLFDAQGLDRLRDEGNCRAREFGLQDRDGSCVPVMFSASCMYDRSGMLRGFIFAATDISEYKALQEQMLQAQKMESLGVLAGGLAHDFNNLLGVMLSNADLIRAELAAESPHYNAVSDIVAAGGQAARLCAELLAYSGKGEHRTELLDLPAIVRHNAELLRSSLPHRIDIKCNVGEDLPPVRGDEVQLMQVVLNLVINAAEAIGDKPGTIALSTSAREVTRDASASEFHGEPLDFGRYVVLEVRDTGCGIAPETLPRIFEPFYSTKITGRGLGLSAIHGIVRSHGGAIRVQSEPGEGTVFQVYLPVSPSQSLQTAEPTEPEQESPDDAQRTVLVVDDEAAILSLTKRMLAHEGCACIEASTGLDGIAKLSQNLDRIDLVMLDLTMPNMGGLETYTRMREMAPHLPIIAFSGYSEGGMARRFPRDENLRFLEKPFDLSQLRDKLADLLPG